MSTSIMEKILTKVSTWEKTGILIVFLKFYPSERKCIMQLYARMGKTESTCVLQLKRKIFHPISYVAIYCSNTHIWLEGVYV